MSNDWFKEMFIDEVKTVLPRPSSDIPEGFSVSYNDLTDKPFYEYVSNDMMAFARGTKLEPTDATVPASRFVFTIPVDFFLNHISEFGTLTINITKWGMSVVHIKDAKIQVMFYDNVAGSFLGCGNAALYDGTSFSGWGNIIVQEENDDEYLLLFDDRACLENGFVKAILTTNNQVITTDKALYMGLELSVYEDVTHYATLDEVFIPDAIARTSQLPAPAIAVSDATGDTPTAEEFNALLAALRNAGYLANE